MDMYPPPFAGAKLWLYIAFPIPNDNKNNSHTQSMLPEKTDTLETESILPEICAAGEGIWVQKFIL